MLCMLFSGCGALVPASDAVNAMEALGFENVKVDGPKFILTAFRGCGRDKALFTTVGTKNGKKVSATVCCGAFFKGCTVRF